jgi:hypothetical protein
MLPIFSLAEFEKIIKTKLFLAIFLVFFLASSHQTALVSFTKDTTSPIPRIRSAIRNRIEYINSLHFSPVPTNLIGFRHLSWPFGLNGYQQYSTK